MSINYNSLYNANSDSLESYPIRTAEIGIISVIDVSQSGNVQLGDRGYFKPLLRALAVQRQEEHAKAGNAYFESYDIFNRPLPILYDPAADAEEAVVISRTNHSPRISVGCINVIAVGSSSSLQAGNTMCVTAESRISNIRQFKRTWAGPGIGSC